MTTTIILRGKPDHFNRYQVYIRKSDKQQRRLIKTSLLLTVDQFERFKKGSPAGTDKNLYKKFLSLMDEPNLIPAGLDFFAFVDRSLQEWKHTKGFETMRQLQSEKNKLKAFKESFLVTDITPDLLNKYQDHLHKIGNTANTVWKSFKFMRMMVLKAIREKLLEDNPFHVFPFPKYKNPKRNYLIDEEIGRIEKLLEDNLPNEIKFAATWFLIGCYTGLRYGDMHSFIKKDHIVKGRIIIYTGKTGEIVSMRLSDKVKGLLESIKYRNLYYTNQTYNRMLKQIKSLAEISKPLTAHISRHTAAVRWANHGISQELTGKLLGHQDLKTTAVYYKLTNQRADEELKDID